MATFNNGESGLSVRNKLNTIINKVEGVTSIDNDIDITGTLTSDGLTTIGATINTSPLRLQSLDTSVNLGESIGDIEFYSNDSSGGGAGVQAKISAIADNSFGTSYALSFLTGASASPLQRLNIAHNGDISFYEDTGTTPKLVWKAADERLGIGTDSPDAPLEIEGSGGGVNLSINNTGTSGRQYILQSTSSAASIGGGKFAVYDGDASAHRFIIDSSGNIGIGTSSPSKKLQISGDRDAILRFENTRTVESENQILGSLEFYSNDESGTGANVRSRINAFTSVGGNSSYLTFSTADGTTDDVERMRIDSSGNLLVGTTAQGGHGIVTGIEVQSASGTNLVCVNTNSTGTPVRFVTSSSTLAGTITTSGSTTAYNTSSDYRLKTDAQPMTGATDRLKQLNPVNFEWIADGTRVDGFLAHEAQEVVPEAVTGEKDAMRDEEYEVTPAVLDDDGNVVTEAVMGTRSVPDYQGIDQSKLVPLLTAALQEALTKIDALETRITALEG